MKKKKTNWERQPSWVKSLVTGQSIALVIIAIMFPIVIFLIKPKDPIDFLAIVFIAIIFLILLFFNVLMRFGWIDPLGMIKKLKKEIWR
ncbi:hypothetical protein ACFLZZ_00705 [Nanoarchaeota archaeon]